ncbi:MAG: PAS domain-containing protein [Bacteroidales bacterium]|nr:PAS domain-containing protein [Bacteroidales bacterium]
MKTSGMLLFYTGNIDFQHLNTYFQNDNFEVVYSDNKGKFEELCLGKKFELIIYNAYNEALIDNSILRGLTGTKNLYTPVLIIAGKEDGEMMKQVMRHQFDMIIFPFLPVELIARIHSSIKRKVTEMAIHNSLLEYRLLFDNYPLGILQTDERGNFMRFNKQLMNILDMHDMNFSGINLFQLCHPDDYLIKRQSLDRMLRREVDNVSYEVRLINNDGQTIVCKLSATSDWKDEKTLGSFIFSVEKMD